MRKKQEAGGEVSTIEARTSKVWHLSEIDDESEINSQWTMLEISWISI